MSILNSTNNPGSSFQSDEFTEAEVLFLEQFASLGDPGADRIVFWDESENELAYLTAGSGLSIVGTTISATGGSITFGTDNQIPYTNAAGDDFEYTASFTFDGTNFVTPGDITVGDDLFISNLGVINFNAGDVTITHSSNTLTLAGGVLVLPDAGLTIGASVPFSDTAGTLTLQNVDALDATTESTIEAAIDTLANLVSIQGRTVTLADAGADALFAWDDSASAYQNLSASDARTALALNTTDNPQFATIELGHASQNTLSAASGVLSIEGVVIPTISSTNTLTNKTLQAAIIDYVIEPASDDTYEGEATNDLNAGDTIAQWDLVYLDSSSGRWEFADADAATTSGQVLLAMATAAGTDGNPMNVIFRGIVRNDGWTWTAGGKPLYVSTTPGGLTETAPSGADDVIRVAGYTLSDDAIYFNPENDWITHT